jgi:hypothetical protein
MIRSVVARCMAWVLGAAFVWGTASASAQEAPTCGDDVKEHIAKTLAADPAQSEPYSEAALRTQQQLYEQYAYCAADGELLAADVFYDLSSQYCGKLTYLGSTFYESMRCCGYDPQKRLFGCPIEVKQPFGFGTAPFPGSREHVLTCVDFGFGYQQVALDSVHLANAVAGRPDWSFAVIARANRTLASLPLNGRSYPARSILSWALAPTSCKYTPIWGNVIEYQIRLDP